MNLQVRILVQYDLDEKRYVTIILKDVALPISPGRRSLDKIMRQILVAGWHQRHGRLRDLFLEYVLHENFREELEANRKAKAMPADRLNVGFFYTFNLVGGAQQRTFHFDDEGWENTIKDLNDKVLTKFNIPWEQITSEPIGLRRS